MSSTTSKGSEAPYTLVEIDGGASVQPPTPVSLSWSNLSYTTAPPTSRSKSTKTDPTHILEAVCGEALQGELLAIVGPAGAGKSTLLSCLAGRVSATSGSMRANGEMWSSSLAQQTRYLPQEDVLFRTLTVLEHMQQQAQLRLGHLVHHEQTSHIAEILNQVGLSDMVSCLVDGRHASTSLNAGQRKLLAVATELLTSPSVLLLDNPLAELDMFMAEQCVRIFQKLTRQGHTIVLTTESPTSVLFELFDKLHLLAGSRTVFRGKATDSLAYFKTHGLLCPLHMNPFEFFHHQLTVREGDSTSAARVVHLTTTWSSHDQLVDLPVLEDSHIQVTSMRTKQSYHTSAWTRLCVLVSRNSLKVFHDSATFRTRSISMIMIAVVIGLIFPQLTVSQTNIQPLSSACYLIATTQLLDNALPELLSVPNEVAIALTEHQAGLYHVLSWYIVKNLIELPLQLFYPMLALVPAYFLVGFPAEAEVFFTFALFLVLVCSTASGMVYFFSCALPRKRVFMLAICFILPCAIFGGPFVNSKTTPVYLKWLQQMSPVKYGYHGTMRAFWSQVESIYCPPNAVCRATNGDAVLASNIIKPHKFASDWQLLLLVNVGFRVAGGLVLWLRARRLR